MNGPWTHRRAWMGVAAAFVSAACFGAVGELEYAKSPPSFGRGVFVSLSRPKKIVQADKLEQLGAVEAVVFEGAAKGIKVFAAMIRTKADTEGFETIRVDLTGKGDFRNALKMSLTTVESASSYYSYYASIGPGVGTVDTGGRDIPVTVTGYYYVARGTPRIGLTLQAAVEGTCAFGKEIRKVRILDTVGDFRFAGPPASPPKLPGGELTSQVGLVARRRLPVGDSIQVADGEGHFDHVRMCKGTALGHPVQVARKWFLVRVEGMKVSAEPLKAPMGKIAGRGDHWQLHLAGRKCRIIVNGAAKAVPVPADTYEVARCIYYRPGRRGEAVPAVKSYRYPRASLEVAEGRTAQVAMGLPMKATISAKVSRGKVTFSVKRVDAAGRRILLVMTAAGRRPVAPAIDVVDETGKVVYTAKLEYG